MSGYETAIAEASAELLREEVLRLRTDLDEARAKNAALREMERERNLYQHGFERLVGRCIGTPITMVDGTEGIETMLVACATKAKLDDRDTALARRIREAVRVDRKA